MLIIRAATSIPHSSPSTTFHFRRRFIFSLSACIFAIRLLPAVSLRATRNILLRSVRFCSSINLANIIELEGAMNPDSLQMIAQYSFPQRLRESKMYCFIQPINYPYSFVPAYLTQLYLQLRKSHDTLLVKLILKITRKSNINVISRDSFKFQEVLQVRRNLQGRSNTSIRFFVYLRN